MSQTNEQRLQTPTLLLSSRNLTFMLHSAVQFNQGSIKQFNSTQLHFPYPRHALKTHHLMLFSILLLLFFFFVRQFVA